MAKVLYELTCEAKYISIVNGIATITQEVEVEIEYINTAEALGEHQSGMLWECFEHSIVVRDDEGKEVQYDETGEMI